MEQVVDFDMAEDFDVTGDLSAPLGRLSGGMLNDFLADFRSVDGSPPTVAVAGEGDMYEAVSFKRLSRLVMRDFCWLICFSHPAFSERT